MLCGVSSFSRVAGLDEIGQETVGRTVEVENVV